jgi:hypothetical protein
MPATTCQYGSCHETVGEPLGVTVSLKVATFDGEKRAVFCCAMHAIWALTALARRRGEPACYEPVEGNVPKFWRVT